MTNNDSTKIPQSGYVTREEFDRLEARFVSMSNDLNDRLSALESQIGSSGVVEDPNFATRLTALESRLDGIPETYDPSVTPFKGLDERLAALESAVNGSPSLNDRLFELEADRVETLEEEMGSAEDRLAKLEENLQINSPQNISDLFNGLQFRLAAVERRLAQTDWVYLRDLLKSGKVEFASSHLNNPVQPQAPQPAVAETYRAVLGNPPVGSSVEVKVDIYDNTVYVTSPGYGVWTSKRSKPAAPEWVEGKVSYYDVVYPDGTPVPEAEVEKALLSQPAAPDLTAQWCFDPACKETGAHYAHPVKPAAPAKRITPELLGRMVDADGGYLKLNCSKLAARLNDFFGGK